MKARTAVTLVELMVVVATLSIVAAVTGLVFVRMQPIPTPNDAVALVNTARDSALRSGRAITMRLRALGARRTVLVTALPDGRVIAEPPLGIDPLTGQASHATP